MAENHSHEPIGPSEAELRESIAAGYEINDVSLSVLLRWGFGLIIFLVMTAAAGLLMWAILKQPQFSRPALGRSLAIIGPTHPPQGTPIVQDNPAGDPRPDNNPRKGVDNIREFRHDEEIRMNEYATQDGNIHIPIDRAMELGIKDFEAQKPGEPPTGVTPTPEMKLNPSTDTTAPGGATGSEPAPAARP